MLRLKGLRPCCYVTSLALGKAMRCTSGEAEFDHVRPWIRGGRTDPANGRVVHSGCHARGRVAASLQR